MSGAPAHEFNPLGWCPHCGAPSWERVIEWHQKRGMAEPPAEDPRSCVPRPKLAPEPRRRGYAIDDLDVIGARLTELRAESAEAEIARACAAMQGRGQSECGQCNDPVRECLVCALRCSKAAAECLICPMPGGGGFKPCPSRS